EASILHPWRCPLIKATTTSKMYPSGGRLCRLQFLVRSTPSLNPELGFIQHHSFRVVHKRLGLVPLPDTTYTVDTKVKQSFQMGLILFMRPYSSFSELKQPARQS